MSDLISRAAAIDALFDWEMTYNWDDHCREEDPKPAYIVSPSDVIEQLPSAQPDRKKGRWKYETMRHLITGGMRTVRICSVCDGGWFRYDMSDGVEEAEPNYCPNCGADMRGEEDGRSDK